MANLDELLTTAQTTAVSAGRLTHELFLQPRQVTSKGLRDIVTDADTAAQKLITDSIRDKFPHHGFVTEEADINLPKNGPVLWVIDPVDGTTNYARQLPIYCVSVAAVSASGQVLAGAIYDPMQDELFSAAHGLGANLNGQPMQVSQVESLADVIVGIDWSRHPQLRQSVFDTLHRYFHEVNVVRAVGSAALAMAWVAAGRLDIYLNYHLQTWDVAAASILLQEAGGKLSTKNGRAWTFNEHDGDCLASNGRVHKAFIDLMSRDNKTG